ncbi:MAG: sugar ABC transporter substrate-binding protein [Treponema sp.]|nr:sugar ABC transporter substrate-binding protein [Treponema sp.]
MEELSAKFTEQTGIRVNFTILSENEIRSKITQDVAFGGGQFDLVTLGTSDTATYLDNGWALNLDILFAAMPANERAAYDLDDIFGSVKDSMTSATKGGLAGLPFYSESTMVFYNREIFAAKGLTMPANPTWDDIYNLAVKANDPAQGICGIAFRGLPGYGQNMYIFGVLVNSFGAQYYDMNWNAKFNTPEMRNALEYYKKLIKDTGEPSPTTCGYTECLNLMASGKAAMWYDATVSAGTLANSSDSQVKGKIGYAISPVAVKKKNTGTIGGWGISITAGTKHPAEAFKFLTWCTSKEYVRLVGETKGWKLAPSGTRKSTYSIPQYQAECDFAEITRDSILAVDYAQPAVNPTPYTGNSLPNLPEYSSWGEACAQELAAYIADQRTVEQVMQNCQRILEDAAVEGGYKK